MEYSDVDDLKMLIESRANAFAAQNKQGTSMNSSQPQDKGYTPK